MSRLEDQIRAIAAELVDGLDPSGFDLVPLVARPLPTRVICHLLGLDLSAETKIAELVAAQASGCQVDGRPR